MATKDKKEKRGRKKENQDDGSVSDAYLKEETIRAIVGVLFFVFGVFLVMSSGPLDKGGFVGRGAYNGLHFLFGIGYYLLPIIFFILCASFFRSLEKRLAITHSVGGLLFFISGLAFVDITLSGQGGFIGNRISSPLVNLFDVPVTLIMLLAFIVISLLVIFDAPLRLTFLSSIFAKIFGKKTSHDEESDLLIANASALDVQPIEAKKIEEGSEAGEKPSMLKKIIGGEAGEKREEFGLGPLLLNGKEFVPPPLSLLEKDKGKPGVGDIKANSNIIKRTLANFGINVEMDEISIGPSITRYALKPAKGVKLSKIVAYQQDLALALAAHPIRIEAPIPGKSLVGIEVPNSTKTKVGLGSLLGSPEFQNSPNPLTMCLGKGISGMSYFDNLASAPHMLVAGATGAGKSVTIHAIITSLLYKNSPDNLKFIMVDPKRVELTLYNKIPHLLTPVITDAKKAILALKWAAKEMDRRYDVLQEHSLQNISSYHKNIVEPEMKRRKSGKGDDEKPVETMPYIVIVIDELADIMQAYPRELEAGIVKLAQMSRAVGIHLILSTQRPSVNVITGLIKANIPTRLALQVASQIDSRTILDMAGAEKLLGAGDMLYLSGKMSQPVRIQSAFISEDETKSIVKYLVDTYESEIPSEINLSPEAQKNSIFEATFDDDKMEEEDDLYEEAKQTVIEAGKASTSYLQRKLGVGYARAARLIDMLEERGVIGPGSGAKPREVLLGGASSPTSEEPVE